MAHPTIHYNTIFELLQEFEFAINCFLVFFGNLKDILRSHNNFLHYIYNL